MAGEDHDHPDDRGQLVQVEKPPQLESHLPHTENITLSLLYQWQDQTTHTSPLQKHIHTTKLQFSQQEKLIPRSKLQISQ